MHSDYTAADLAFAQSFSNQEQTEKIQQRISELEKRISIIEKEIALKAYPTVIEKENAQ